MKQGSKRSLFILFSVIVLDLIGFGIVIPILPFYAEAFGANATILGLLLTSYSAMQFLFSSFWGKLSDRIGRKNVLLITIFGSSLGLLILGLANSLWLVFVGRILSGIFAANIGVASAYISDVTDESNRAKGMGLIGVAFGLGFILGPTIGGILSIYGYSTPILAAAGLSLLNVAYTKWRLVEPTHVFEKKERDLSFFSMLQDSFVRRLCGINFLFTFGVNQLETVFAFFMLARFHYDARRVAYVLAMMALIMVGIQGGMIKRLVTRFGEKNLLLSGCLFLGLAFFLVPKSYIIWVLLFPLALSAIGRGISQPSLLSLVSKGATPAGRGSVMGIFQASASLARVFGPIAAGFLYDRSPSLPFYLAGGLMGAVLLLSFGVKVPVAEWMGSISSEIDVATS